MTVRNVAARLAQVLLICGAQIVSAQSAKEATCTERWQPPRELRTPEGYTVYLDQPSLMPLRGKMFFISYHATAYDSTGHFVFPLSGRGWSIPRRAEDWAQGVIVGTDGPVRLVRPPKDLRVFPWMPQGVVDDRGVAHIIFGSNDDSLTTQLLTKRSLWYTQFDGEQWTTPTRILTSPGALFWNPSQASRIVARGRTLHAVVVIQREGVRYIRGENGVWMSRHIDIDQTHLGYPQLAILSTGRVVLMINGLVPTPLGRMQGFFATWSDDEGKSWAPLVQITGADGAPGYDARLVADDQDILYALWYQVTNGEGNPSTKISLIGSPGRVHVAVSSDRGASWQRFPPTPVIESANGLQVLLRPDHSVLVALVDRSNERMLVTSWSKAWAPFLEIEAKPDPFNPSLGADDAQRPFLSWGIQHNHDWVGTAVTTLLPCR